MQQEHRREMCFLHFQGEVYVGKVLGSCGRFAAAPGTASAQLSPHIHMSRSLQESTFCVAALAQTIGLLDQCERCLSHSSYASATSSLGLELWPGGMLRADSYLGDPGYESAWAETGRKRQGHACEVILIKSTTHLHFLTHVCRSSGPAD